MSALVLLPDGNILVAGWDWDERFGYLARRLSDGTPDVTFGTRGTGIVGTDFGSRSRLAVQPDGRIVVAGWRRDDRGGVARFFADGSVDTGFGNGGYLRVPGDLINAVVLRPDGRILVLGPDSEWIPYGGYALTQLQPDGSLDPTFGGGNGHIVFDLPFEGGGVLALQPDGRIVTTGAASGQVQGDHYLARHLSDGNLDPSFGDGGYVLTDFGPEINLRSRGIAIQPDGRILTGGAVPTGPSPANDFLLVRSLGDAAVAVSAAPASPPVTLPPGGGSFAFTLTLANVSNEPQTVEVWTEADGPAAASPSLGPRTVTLAPGAILMRTIRQRVPAAAPAGDYVYTVHAGAFPGGAVTSASFPLTKEAGALAARAADDAWTASGWDNGAAASASEATAALALSVPSPHPFREGARLTLSVPSAQAVRVAVYDALGREVAVLHNGALGAGTHALALDGARLAAGVYVVRTEGAGGVAARRVVRY